MIDFLLLYFIIGFLVSLIGALILAARGEDSTLGGFMLDMGLWPVVVLFFIGWLIYNWSEVE